MTTPSGEFPWQAANATDGLAWYAGQGIDDWKIRMVEDVTKTFLSFGLWALKVPLTDDLADAVIGPGAELDGDIPVLTQINDFLSGKFDLMDDIGAAVEGIVDVFTAILKAAGGDFSDLPSLIESMLGSIGSLLGGWIIDPSRLPLIPLGSIFIPGLGSEPNLLTGFGDFGSADTIDDPSGAWSWDASVGRTTAGAAKATADGNRKVLVGDLIPSREDQKFNVSAWTRWTALVVAAGVDAIEVNVRAYAGGTQLSETTLATIASPVGTSSWVELAGEYTVPAGADGVRVCLSVEAACTAGEVWFDDVTGKRPGLLPQVGVDGLPEALSNLLGYVQSLVQELLGRLGIPVVGSLLDQILDLSDGIESWKLGTDGTAADLSGLFGDLLSNPTAVLGSLPSSLFPDFQSLLNQLGGGGGTGIGDLPVLGDIIGAVTDGATGGNLTTGNPLTDLWNNMFGLHQAAQSALTSAAAANTQLAAQQQDTESGDTGLRFATTFGGADEAALGSPWTSTDVVIKNGYAGLRDAATTNGSNYLAKSSNTASRDDQVVAVVLGDQGDAANTRIIIRADALYTMGVYVNVTKSGLTLGRWTNSGATLTQWATVTTNVAGGAAIRVRAVGNVYTVMLNGIDVLSHTDTGTTAPIGPAYRRAGFTLGTDTGWFGIRYYSLRLASFMHADYNPPGASTMDSWRLTRASTTNVALSVANGATAALPISFLTTTENLSGATVSNLGRGEVTVAKSGHYWITFGATVTGRPSTTAGLKDAALAPYWSLMVDGAIRSGATAPGVPCPIFLTAGQVVSPMVSSLTANVAIGSGDPQHIAVPYINIFGPAHFSGVYMGA